MLQCLAENAIWKLWAGSCESKKGDAVMMEERLEPEGSSKAKIYVLTYTSKQLKCMKPQAVACFGWWLHIATEGSFMDPSYFLAIKDWKVVVIIRHCQVPSLHREMAGKGTEGEQEWLRGRREVNYWNSYIGQNLFPAQWLTWNNTFPTTA